MDGRLKIKEKDYKELKQAIQKTIEKITRKRLKEAISKFSPSPKKLCWDMLTLSRYDTRELYTYLNDNNIETAMKHILKEFNII